MKYFFAIILMTIFSSSITFPLWWGIVNSYHKWYFWWGMVSFLAMNIIVVAAICKWVKGILEIKD